MKGKKLILIPMAIALLMAIPAVVLAAAMKAESHATPPTTIEADFKFTDTGSKLTITGKAKGLEPNHFYVSLIYDTGSSVTGIHACEPTDNSLGPRMFVGFWNVLPNGKGTLGPVVKEGAGPTGYVALSEIGTISVRAGKPTGPGTFPVVACGEVK